MSNLNFEKNGNTLKPNKIGFYLVFGLCLTAAAVVWWSVSNRDDAVAPDEEPVYTLQDTSSQDEWENLLAEANAGTESEEEDDTSSQPETTSSEAEKVTATAAREKVTYTAPVEGKLIKKFSGEELVYSATLCDWRVHDGIDLAAENGSEVKACAAGDVIDVYSDELFATTVVIRHSSTVTAYYRGLADKPAVAKGDKVTAGSVLGKVGEISCESSDESHIHLSVKSGGSYVDPIKTMSLVIKS